ncbi:aldolase [Actinomadura sp. DSM 109109]|nr:aldolase [Actinomadura lepetitiana]
MTPGTPAVPAGSRAERIAGLTEVRASRPEAVAEAARARVRRASLMDGSGRLMLVAADHPARGALAAGGDPLAMADRGELLDRLCTALERPGVDGVLGTPDVVEDLLLLGVLEGKVVIGSMNRGGLAGASFEVDDRFTAYGAEAIARSGLDGGKMLLRVDEADPASVRTLEACAGAVSELAERGLMAMVEPFMCRRVDGRVRNDLTPEAMTRAMAIASGLGVTSAYTWLKVPVVAGMERVMATSTLPALLLGGEVAADQRAAREGWRRALRLPTVRGLVVGRSLLYPPDGDVAGAVDAAVDLL